MTQRKATSQVVVSATLLVVAGCSGTTSSGTADVVAQGGTTTLTATGGKTSSDRATGGAAIGGDNATSASGGNAIGGKATGGSVTIGGASTGGKATGGSATIGGASTGGKATGGSATIGGASTGGKASAGSATIGGASTGGKATGGSVTIGGASTGGKATGGSATGGTTSGTAGKSGFVLPTANASFDYQIGGAYTPPSGVTVVSRDRNSAPAAGIYNICYVNGFQAQPDEESFWTTQHPTLILRDTAGNPVVDAGWDEMLLDTSTAAKRTELALIVGGWIAKCKTDGFNAVEIDNLDSYSRSTGLLTEANNIAFMALLSSTAHANGLAIAQKNSSELLGSKAAMGTDFAVVEECNRYSECGTYKAAYGNLVFIIEYRSQDFQSGCSTYPELSIVLRDLNVSAPGNAAYVYQGC